MHVLIPLTHIKWSSGRLVAYLHVESPYIQITSWEKNLHIQPSCSPLSSSSYEFILPQAYEDFVFKMLTYFDLFRKDITVVYRSNYYPLKPNEPYSGRTAPLTSKRCILYIYSTNICTVYFKHGIYSRFLTLQNVGCFIILTYLVRVLFTFYVQDVLKLKKNSSGSKRLIEWYNLM